MLGHWNLEWNNHNANRAFPIAADASRLNDTDDFQIPNSFLVGMYLSINAGNNVGPGRFFVKSIGIYSSGFAVTIGYQPDDGDAVTVASAQINRADHEPNAAYRLVGLGSFFDSEGVIVIGHLDDIDQQPAGVWNFELDGGRLEADVIRPMIRGMTGLYIANGSVISGPFTGDIVLRAGTNYRIDSVTGFVDSSADGFVDSITGNAEAGYTVTIDGTPHHVPAGYKLKVIVGDDVDIDEVIAVLDPTLVLNAIEGEGLNESCVCTEETQEPIRTINGVRPDVNGNLNMLGNACLEWSAVPQGLQAQDTCSQPCCGCNELEAITAALEDFGRQAQTLENFVNRLDSSVTTMDLVVLGSRLSDRGCGVPTEDEG